MKKLLVFMAITFVSSLILSGQNKGIKQYTVKSGIIEYKHEGAVIGTETVYFDEYGSKVASYSNTNRQGEQKEGWVITLDEFQYIFNPEESSEGLKMKNPLIQQFKNCQNIQQCSEDMLAKLGYKKEGTKLFLGKTCTVWKSQHGEMLVWKGIMLRNEMSMTGYKTLQYATSFKENASVPASKFEIPEDITFNEIPGMF